MFSGFGTCLVFPPSPGLFLKVVTGLHAKTLPPTGKCCPLLDALVALQNNASATVGLSPSEQLQTPSDIVHHLLLTHDGQDSAGARLHLGKPCILDQVGGQAEAHGQGLQLQ